eukprot:COSAG01_NODE_8332_length_2825_cov_2.895451_2_plen_133_part_00
MSQLFLSRNIEDGNARTGASATASTTGAPATGVGKGGALTESEKAVDAQAEAEAARVAAEEEAEAARRAGAGVGGQPAISSSFGSFGRTDHGDALTTQWSGAWQEAFPLQGVGLMGVKLGPTAAAAAARRRR